LLTAAPVAAQGPELPDGTRDSIAVAVARHMDHRRIPGLSIAVGAGGRVIFAAGYGKADLEHDVPVTVATSFRIQSVQKLLTAVAVLRLAELSRLRLDDALPVHCPAFGARPWPVTLRQLLSHQGGIRPSDLADLFNRDHYATTAAAVRRFARDSLASQPGTAVRYSNAGYTLLACALEGATGRPYDSVLSALVLGPAGMSATREDDPYAVIPGRARYYVVRTAENTEQWRGLWSEVHLALTPVGRPANADPVDPSWAIGAGSYLGPPSDLVRFGLALLDGRLLGPPYRDSAFAAAALSATGGPTGRTLGGWVADDAQTGVARMLGSTWNGSFGLAVDRWNGVVVAIASNIEFDQPGELVDRVLELVRPHVSPAAAAPDSVGPRWSREKSR